MHELDSDGERKKQRGLLVPRWLAVLTAGLSLLGLGVTIWIVTKAETSRVDARHTTAGPIRTPIDSVPIETAQASKSQQPFSSPDPAPPQAPLDSPTDCVSAQISVTALRVIGKAEGRGWNIGATVANSTGVEINLYGLQVYVATASNPGHYDQDTYLSPPHTPWGMSPGETVEVSSVFWDLTAEDHEPTGLSWARGYPGTWAPTREPACGIT